MKDAGFAALNVRINQELDELQRILDRITLGWERARRSNDDFYLDSVALNLHGFYSGFERIFTHIAETVDGDLPRGEDWHRLLLQQMTREIPELRPAVVSIPASQVLDDLHRFRHVVRNVYTHHLDPERLGKLVKASTEVFAQLRAELTAFCAFLENGET